MMSPEKRQRQLYGSCRGGLAASAQGSGQSAARAVCPPGSGPVGWPPCHRRLTSLCLACSVPLQPDGRVAHFELVLCKSVDTYVRVKQNQNQVSTTPSTKQLGAGFGSARRARGCLESCALPRARLLFPPTHPPPDPSTPPSSNTHHHHHLRPLHLSHP